MSLTERLAEAVRACFTAIWIQSFEQPETLTLISQLCRRQDWRLAAWDLEQGLQCTGAEPADIPVAADPLSALRALPGLGTVGDTTLLVLTNFHRFLNSLEIIQALLRQILLGKQQRTFVVILAPTIQIPIELKNLFLLLEHPLPEREQLLEIAQSMAADPAELPTGTELDRLLDAAAGLTGYEAEGAFALSLTRHGRLAPDVIWELKAQSLRTSGLLGLHRGAERFDQLGGLDNLKTFALRILRPGTRSTLCRPRGLLLLSPPGCGKSQFAKALGRETGRPTLTLEIGSLMGSLVGQSEQNIRQALQIADAMAPCILFMDELEKGLAGAMSQGTGDSGVSARLFGTLLTWLNDHTSDVFVVATCNDIARLPSEFARAERFDGVFFIDLPGAEERQAIWRMYMEQFELAADQRLPNDEQWTGAEIRACCRLAALLDVPLVQAAQNVVPVAVTAAESVERLRTWASGRCLSADQPGIFRTVVPPKSSRRRVSRDPSNN